jgi:hypothetical protein
MLWFFCIHTRTNFILYEHWSVHGLPDSWVNLASGGDVTQKNQEAAAAFLGISFIQM